MATPIFKNNDIELLRSQVQRADRVVVTCHKAPDGDAVGSSLALFALMRAMGKSVDVITPDMPLKQLMFAPNANLITVNSLNEKLAYSLLQKADMVFCLDFNALHRIDRLADAITDSKAFKVLLDHHIEPENFCDLTLSFPDGSSTCELLYHLIYALGYDKFINREVAQCLYMGMMTDTGNFTFGSDYPDIYIAIADLLRFDIDKERIYNLALNTYSADSLRLRGYALNEKMQIFPEKGVACILISKDELERFHYKKGDLEGLVNKPLCIPEISMSFLFREDPFSGNVKISARSQGERSVEAICRDHFGGGGHLNAAGGEFNGSIGEAWERFAKVLTDL